MGAPLIEPQLFAEQDMEDVIELTTKVGEVMLYSHSSPDRETEDPNQDAAAVFPIDKNRIVVVVADGAGGVRAGNKASKIAIDSLKENLSKVADSKTELRTIIVDAFETANAKVMELGVGAMTTMTVLEITQDGVRTFHAGDSTVIIVGNKGKIKHQTVGHGPVAYAVHAGVLSESEGMLHAERHLVSNMIGCKEMHIELGPTIDIGERDTVLVASDGLFDNLTTEQICDVIRKGPLMDSTRQLISECKEQMEMNEKGVPSKKDDLTILTFRKS
jgi:serine/threonine protein phosphatase PrpC